jgi:hypothetical protein
MKAISKRGREIGGLMLLAAALMFPAPASAGTFTVSGTCGLWRPYNYAPGHIAVYPACSELVTRNVGGSFASSPGAEGGWIFDAPGGTSIASFAVQGALQGFSGWQAALFPSNGSPVENCPGSNCPGGTKQLGLQWWYSGLNSPAIVLRLRCGANGGCPHNTAYGYAGITAANVTIADGVPPGIGITGGQILSGWQRGTPTVTYDAGDNVGIKLVRAYLDGRIRAEEQRACSYASTVPCPNGGGALSIDTTGLADGAHVLTVHAIDSADNGNQDARTVYLDNTAPASPGALALHNGDAWSATNRFDLRWTDPPQFASPIVAADYALCPASNAVGDTRRCIYGSRNGSNINTIPDLQVPDAGAWRLLLHLRDAAGNSDPATSATITGVRYDPTPPEASFLPISADDPARVRVAASDATSGVNTEALEIQRDGTDTWTEVAVTPDATGFSAAIDDGALPDGTYRLRARVTDAAGNDRTVESLPSGQLATLALPIRIKTRLAVGKVKHVLARSSRHGKKRYRRVLIDRPRSRYGRTVRLSGRLTTPGANPVAGSPVEVWEQVELPGAPWTRIAEVNTSRTGRFVFKALRGPSRLLTFRYGGTATIRSRASTVDLRVRASSSMRVDRHRVLNGDSVVFRGRLKGRPLPAGGKLVELQVYSRGQWRTFAQARADAATGLWAYRYRFEAITGRVRFRFRARIRKEAAYPFDLGTSRQVRVTVRGS